MRSTRDFTVNRLFKAAVKKRKTDIVNAQSGNGLLGRFAFSFLFCNILLYEGHKQTVTKNRNLIWLQKDR